MAEKAKGQTIVIKKKKGHGHGHHGGAWKVAYADFVTAMMAFFLVMWLMGADDAQKAEISSYFNMARTAWKPDKDIQSKEIIPVGERTGQGESIVTGMGAGYPEDLIERPARPIEQKLEANRKVSDVAQEVLEGQAYGVDVSVDYMKFSVPSSFIFKPGTKEFGPHAKENLEKIAQIFKSFSGYITIAGHVSDDFAGGRKLAGAGSSSAPDPYEFTLSQSVAVMHYFVDNNLVTEDRMTPLGNGLRNKYSASDNPESRARNDRIEFTLSDKRPVQ